MRVLVLLSFVAIGLSACKKDQKAVNKLAGSWTVTSWEVKTGSVTIDLIGIGGSADATFDDCDLDANTWCGYTGHTYFLGLSDTVYSQYRVIDKGTKLEIKDSTGTVNTSTILELTDSNLKLEQINTDETIWVTATKQ